MSDLGKRLSIPGNFCVHCDAIITESIICPGCGWADPLTRKEIHNTFGEVLEQLNIPIVELDALLDTLEGENDG